MNRHNLLLTRHVANEYGGWVKIVKGSNYTISPLPGLNIEKVTG